MSQKLKSAVAGAIAVVVVFVVAGCGGGGGDSTGSSTTASSAGAAVPVASLSKAKFESQANNLCAARLRKIEPIVRKGIATGKDIKGVEAAVDPVVEEVVDGVQELGAPAAERSEVEAMLAALQQDLAASKQAPSTSMEELAAKFKHSGELSAALGISACAFG